MMIITTIRVEYVTDDPRWPQEAIFKGPQAYAVSNEGSLQIVGWWKDTGDVPLPGRTTYPSGRWVHVEETNAYDDDPFWDKVQALIEQGKAQEKKA